MATSFDEFNQSANTGTGAANFFLNMLSGGLYSYLNGIQQEDAYNFSERSAESAFYRSLYAWRLNNDYNSPTNQMARLKAAGLNPHLVSNNLSNTSSQPNITPGKTFALGGQYDFVGNFLRVAEVMNDLRIKRQDANIRAQSADDDHKVKEAQANNILQDTILKQIGVKKGNYEFNKWYPEITSKYQEEVHKLGNENYLLYLQGQRQKLENQIRSYWKENHMMNDFEFDTMMKEYTAKAQKKRYLEFMPIEKELMGYNRDIRKQEYDYLSTYGTSSPGSQSFMGFPLSGIFGGDAFQQKVFNAGKTLLENIMSFMKGAGEAINETANPFNPKSKYRQWHDSLPWILQ